MLLLPLSRVLPAPGPSAVLRLPVESRRALVPTATLLPPVVLLKRALTPLAVLLNPVVLFWSALTPADCAAVHQQVRARVLRWFARAGRNTAHAGAHPPA